MHNQHLDAVFTSAEDTKRPSSLILNACHGSLCQCFRFCYCCGDKAVANVIKRGSWHKIAPLKTRCKCRPRFCRCTNCTSDAAGAVPAKGRPATSWGHNSPLTAEPLPGWECTSSILHIHLTQQHLVVMHASAGSSAAASAIWLDNHSLQQIARLALPTNICHAWTDFGLSKAIVSTTCGSVFTFSVHLQVQPCCHCLLHALQEPTCTAQSCC